MSDFWEILVLATRAIASILSVACVFGAVWHKYHDRDTAALWLLGWAILFEMMSNGR